MTSDIITSRAEKEKKVLELYYDENNGYADVAKKLHLSFSTIADIINRDKEQKEKEAQANNNNNNNNIDYNRTEKRKRQWQSSRRRTASRISSNHTNIISNNAISGRIRPTNR
jgi:transposase